MSSVLQLLKVEPWPLLSSRPASSPNQTPTHPSSAPGLSQTPELQVESYFSLLFYLSIKSWSMIVRLGFPPAQPLKSSTKVSLPSPGISRAPAPLLMYSVHCCPSSFPGPGPKGEAKGSSQLSGAVGSGPAPLGVLCSISRASQKKSFCAAISGIQPTISFIFSMRSCSVGQLWIWLRYSSQARAVPPGSWVASAPKLGSAVPRTLLAGRSR